MASQSAVVAANPPRSELGTTTVIPVPPAKQQRKLGSVPQNIIEDAEWKKANHFPPMILIMWKKLRG